MRFHGNGEPHYALRMDIGIALGVLGEKPSYATSSLRTSVSFPASETRLRQAMGAHFRAWTRLRIVLGPNCGGKRMSETKTTNWKVRPGYAFSAGAGVGAGLLVFEFLNADEKRVHGMGFGGLGLAGGILGGNWQTAREAIMKLAVQLAIKTGAAATGAYIDAVPGFKDQIWSDLPCNKAFSSDDLDNSTGRVTILGASIAKHGYYKCYVSASEGLVSWTPLFSSAHVDIRPQNINLQIGAILGVWWEAFDVPNS